MHVNCLSHDERLLAIIIKHVLCVRHWKWDERTAPDHKTHMNIEEALKLVG